MSERLDIVVREDGSRVVRRNIAEIGKGATDAARGVQLLQRAMLGLTVGAGLIFLQRQVDEYTNLQNRLRLVTSGTAQLKQATDQLFASANRTRSEFGATVELYASLARSTRELGISQKELVGITETINQAVKISGTEAATAAMGLRQLGQALASGVLRGDEFNSIMENMPRVAEAIAKSMGVSIGELRKLAAEGKLTAREIVQAFRTQAPLIAEEFKKVQPTIADGFVVLRNHFLKFIGDANQATGASVILANSIILLANNLKLLAQVVTVAVTAFVLFKAALAAQALIAYVQGLMALQVALGATTAQAFATGVAMRGLKASLAFLLSPATLGVLGITALAAALVMLASDAMEASSILSSLEDSSRTAVFELLDMEAKARAAGMQVDSLGNAAAMSNPIIAGIAKQYGVAADEAQRLANNARAAAIAVAQGKIAELSAKRDTLMGPVNAVEKSQTLSPAWIGGHVSQLGQGLFGGPSVAERKAGAGTLGSQIDIYKRQIDILSKAPQDFFKADPLKGGGGAGDKDKKDKKGGGGQTRSEFLAEVNRETDNSIMLTGILDENWRRVQEQIVGINEHMVGNKWSALTEGETQALQGKLAALRDAAELEQTRDNIARSFNEPMKELVRTETAGQQLMEAGTITMAQYGRAVEEARLRVLALSDDAKDGIEAGLILVAQEARNEAGRLRDAITSIWQGTKGPMLQYEAGQRAINALLREGKFNAQEAADAVRDLRIAYLETKKDVGSGLELGQLRTARDNDNEGGRVARAYEDAYQGANGELQQLISRQSALQQLMIDDPINSGQYANQLRIVGAEMQALMPGANMFDQARAGLAAYAADFKGILPGMRQAWTSAFQRMGDGAAQALSRAIVYGEKLGTALKDVARSALTELIAALIKMGIQWVITSVLGTAAQSAVGAASVATGAAVTAAWTPAAVAVSLATFGANAPLAMAGMSAAFALGTALSAVSKAGGFRDGGYTGNMGVNEVAGMVHGKEYVFDAESVSKLGVPFLESLRKSSGRGYKSGGYVGSSSSAFFGGGAVEPTANVREGDIHLAIDARGSSDESAVEEKITNALEAALPIFLDKSRRQEATVASKQSRRQGLGSYRGR